VKKIEFLHKDAFEVIPKYLRNKSAAFFVDPPYTASGKSAGGRLYLHSSIDHDSLFDLLESAAGEVMPTYDDAKEVRDLASAHGFFIKSIPMKTTHHARAYELAITNQPFPAMTSSDTLRFFEQPGGYRINRGKQRKRSRKRSARC
jgi:DNA adenine methylase